MKATKVKMSAHVVDERLDRLTYIAINVGFGNVVLEGTNRVTNDGRIDCITDTGVLIIKAPDGKIITAYLPTVDKVVAIYRNNGVNHVPSYIINKVKKNAYHAKMSNIVKY